MWVTLSSDGENWNGGAAGVAVEVAAIFSIDWSSQAGGIKSLSSGVESGGPNTSDKFCGRWHLHNRFRSWRFLLSNRNALRLAAADNFLELRAWGTSKLLRLSYIKFGTCGVLCLTTVAGPTGRRLASLPEGNENCPVQRFVLASTCRGPVLRLTSVLEIRGTGAVL